MWLNPTIPQLTLALFIGQESISLEAMAENWWTQNQDWAIYTGSRLKAHEKGQSRFLTESADAEMQCGNSKGSKPIVDAGASVTSFNTYLLSEDTVSRKPPMATIVNIVPQGSRLQVA